MRQSLQAGHLPFEAGLRTHVSQGFMGYVSHKDAHRYAVDFNVRLGTPVAAFRAGIVKRMRSDSNKGCGTKKCADDANFVEIDHGDGTFGRYWHLKQHGVEVAVGQSVCAGALLGYSGNTGFSTAPHLHMSVVDLFGYTQPIVFHEYAGSAGIPQPKLKVTSQNAPESGCRTAGPSECPSTVFAHMGVILEPGAACSILERDRAYRYRGRLLAGHGRLRVSVMHKGTWRDDCHPTDEDGHFDIELKWPSNKNGAKSHLMLARAKDDKTRCAAVQGWDASPRLALIPKKR